MNEKEQHTGSMIQTFDWGRTCLAVSRDSCGDLTVVEHDGEGITIRAWKLTTLVRFAQQWDDAQQAKKFEASVDSLRSLVGNLTAKIANLENRKPRFGWKR